MKVLVAEDDLANRKLVECLLEKNGHTVVTSENGRAVFAALETEQVDVVLMNVRTPVMDGFETIRSIRAAEQRTGRRLPIIVLTPHAMEGDRERCLEAGADDYLTKPIRGGALLAALKRVTGAQAQAAPAEQPQPTGTRAWDLEAALARMENDRELLEEIVGLYADEWPRTLAGMRRAIQTQDAALLHRLAHTLKGASANISAPGVRQAALSLEMLARSGDIANAGEHVDLLQAEAGRLMTELETWSGKALHVR